MTWKRRCASIACSIFVATFLCMTPDEGKASNCSGIDADVYKKRLLSLKIEYVDVVLRLGSDGLKSNELLVGREIDSVLQDVYLLITMVTIVDLFCDSGVRSRSTGIWKEVVDCVNGALPTFHKNLQSSNGLIVKSLKESNRVSAIAHKLQIIISDMEAGVPRSI